MTLAETLHPVYDFLVRIAGRFAPSAAQHERALMTHKFVADSFPQASQIADAL